MSLFKNDNHKEEETHDDPDNRNSHQFLSDPVLGLYLLTKEHEIEVGEVRDLSD